MGNKLVSLLLRAHTTVCKYVLCLVLREKLTSLMGTTCDGFFPRMFVLLLSWSRRPSEKSNLFENAFVKFL